jgi:flagellar biogenesis protein FliO
MLPDVPLAFWVLLALLPGWIFVRLAETRCERPDRSQLAELLELAAVGFSTTAVSAIAVASLSLIKGFSWVFNVAAWAHTRNQYLGDHLATALGSMALIIALSCALAFGLFVLVHRRRRPGDRSFNVGGTVWVAALTALNGRMSTVGVYLHDGSIIEGVLFCCTAGTGDGPREIALTAPIRVTRPNGNPYNVPVNRIVILESEIAFMTVGHVPRPDGSPKGAPKNRGSSSAPQVPEPQEDLAQSAGTFRSPVP